MWFRMISLLSFEIFKKIVLRKTNFQDFQIYLHQVQQMRLCYLTNLKRYQQPINESYNMTHKIWVIFIIIQDPTPSPPPEIIDTPREEPVSTLTKDSRIPQTTPTATTTDETTRRSKRTKFGVDDEQVSLEDARSKFGPAT